MCAFDHVDTADVEEAFATWRAVYTCRTVVASFSDLDALGRDEARPRPSVRWVLVHMIEEYARHNGHADLLRVGSTASWEHRPFQHAVIVRLTRSPWHYLEGYDITSS